MRIAAVSDMHGHLKFSIKPSDLLLIAGDVCPAYKDKYLSLSRQYDFLWNEFYPWLLKQPVKQSVFIFGNHDWIGDTSVLNIPPIPNNCHYIEDSEIIIDGAKIYGTPVQPCFRDWAFNRREPILQRHWDDIPEGTDILLTHCPPYGILDKTKRGVKIGSKSLLSRIKKIKPKIVIFGHNHEGYGVDKVDDIICVNASILNERYRMSNSPVYIDFKLE